MANIALKPGPGRPRKLPLKQITEKIIFETGPEAAKYLNAVIKKKEKPQKELIDAAKFVVNQSIGMATQKAQNSEEIIIRTIYDEPPKGYIDIQVKELDSGIQDTEALVTPRAEEVEGIYGEEEDMQGREKGWEDNIRC
jgi:DNA-binding phage protein